jgi:hypothetical protein
VTCTPFAGTSQADPGIVLRRKLAAAVQAHVHIGGLVSKVHEPPPTLDRPLGWAEADNGAGAAARQR